ncbi:MAG TPA: ERF family protein [Polyangiales bacterium]|nr:ERF family protein [Polyangiales bacterium]
MNDNANVRAPAQPKLAAALAKASADIGAGVARNARNSHLGNEYADLGAVVEAVKPNLAKHELSFVQIPGELGEVAGSMVVSVLALLIHSSGEHLSWRSEMIVAPPERKGGGVGPIGPQQIGSAISYLRRYQLRAVFCLADRDDDAEDAQQSAPQQRSAKVESPNRAPVQPTPVSSTKAPEPKSAESVVEPSDDVVIELLGRFGRARSDEQVRAVARDAQRLTPSGSAARRACKRANDEAKARVEKNAR